MTARSAALLTVFALSLAPCAAQEGAKVRLQFLSFPRSIDPAPVELVVGEGKTITVELPSNELSEPYEVPRLATWALGESGVDADGKPVFRSFGQAPALPSPSQLILVVRKGAEYADGFELIPVDNRVKEFGGGKFLFMNASKVDIAGEIGSEKFALKPGAHVMMEPKAKPGERNVQTSLYFRADGNVKPFFSSAWPVGEAARSLIFFYHDPDSHRLRLHSIRDFP